MPSTSLGCSSGLHRVPLHLQCCHPLSSDLSSTSSHCCHHRSSPTASTSSSNLLFHPSKIFHAADLFSSPQPPSASRLPVVPTATESPTQVSSPLPTIPPMSSSLGLRSPLTSPTVADLSPSELPDVKQLRPIEAEHSSHPFYRLSHLPQPLSLSSSPSTSTNVCRRRRVPVVPPPSYYLHPAPPSFPGEFLAPSTSPLISFAATHPCRRCRPPPSLRLLPPSISPATTTFLLHRRRQFFCPLRSALPYIYLSLFHSLSLSIPLYCLPKKKRKEEVKEKKRKRKRRKEEEKEERKRIKEETVNNKRRRRKKKRISWRSSFMARKNHQPNPMLNAILDEMR